MSEIERPSKNSARAEAVYECEPGEALEAAARAIERLSNWRLAGRSETSLRAVRATSLLRFKDDVTVTAASGAGPGKTRLTLESASRVGKGDLGQNPRNLRELLGALDTELGRAAGRGSSREGTG